MANAFLNIPSQAANGVGASVDFSNMGAQKSIVCSGAWPETMKPTITIEMNNDPGQLGSWAPVCSFFGNGEQVVQVAAMWLRARVSNFKQGTAPQIDVGGQVQTVLFAQLVAPPGNGVGAAVDISLLGPFKTITVGDEFRGTTIIEMSTDGTTDWGQPFAFTTPGQKSGVFTGGWARIRRTGVPEVNPGLPVINIGATDTAGGGGGITAQSFTYTVTGLEPDTSDFMVTLPFAEAADSYEVQATPAGGIVGAGGLGDFVIGLNCPDQAVGDRTTTEFRVRTTFPLVAGDEIDFLVSE